MTVIFFYSFHCSLQSLLIYIAWKTRSEHVKFLFIFRFVKKKLNFTLNFKVVIMLLVNISLTKHIFFFMHSSLLLLCLWFFYFTLKISWVCQLSFLYQNDYLGMAKIHPFVNIMSQNGVNDVSIFIFILPNLYV